MSDSIPSSTVDPLMYTAAITADLGITDRCLREWVSAGKFARPDTNIGGRNAWLSSTYKREKAAIMAGRFRQARRPLGGCRSNPPEAA
jgi:hypothetical protein